MTGLRCNVSFAPSDPPPGQAIIGLQMDPAGWIFGALAIAFGVDQWRRSRRFSDQLDRVEAALRERAPERAEEIVRRVTEEAVVQHQQTEQETEEKILPASYTREAVGEAIARLPEREKLVVTLYYYEDLSLEEIAEVLGVTHARAHQIHEKAILRLKSRLDPQNR